MLKSILMGLVGGQRALTPLAVVAVAAARGELPRDNGAPRVLGHPAVVAGAVALAVGEMAGDKLKSAPDRVMPAGLVARFVTSAIAGAALAPRHQRWTAAAAGGTTALVASYVGWRTRLKAMERQSQTATGFVEDAAVLGSAAAVVRA
ncbi:DUF4126 family protein [Erythrobacter sp. NFXS35]|uniref:DUF4126 family protein n=1 Tax=Erythrobacter sp. NFXS35 TaxID=2818436 RepID=UPI0032DF3D4F